MADFPGKNVRNNSQQSDLIKLQLARIASENELEKSKLLYNALERIVLSDLGEITPDLMYHLSMKYFTVDASESSRASLSRNQKVVKMIKKYHNFSHTITDSSNKAQRELYLKKIAE